MTKDTSITISHGLEISCPTQERAIPIPKSDWDHLKILINRIELSDTVYENFGYLCIGFAGSSVICYLTSKSQIWVIIFVAALILGLALCHLGRKAKKIPTRYKKDAIEEMERLETRYPTLT